MDLNRYLVLRRTDTCGDGWEIMPREINHKDTTRARAFELWMEAPNPMITFFKTFDVTNLVRASKKRKLKFNMLIDYCIGRAAVSVKEFYLLPNNFLQIYKTRLMICSPIIVHIKFLVSHDDFVDVCHHKFNFLALLHIHN